MNKKIEVTPEWVLGTLPNTLQADGDGNNEIFTNSITDSNWIILALNTLQIKFEEFETGDFPSIDYGIKFKIKDIEEECPSLYKLWIGYDHDNYLFKLNKSKK